MASQWNPRGIFFKARWTHHGISMVSLKRISMESPWSPNVISMQSMWNFKQNLFIEAEWNPFGPRGIQL